MLTALGFYGNTKNIRIVFLLLAGSWNLIFLLSTTGPPNFLHRTSSMAWYHLPLRAHSLEAMNIPLMEITFRMSGSVFKLKGCSNNMTPNDSPLCS